MLYRIHDTGVAKQGKRSNKKIALRNVKYKKVNINAQCKDATRLYLWSYGVDYVNSNISDCQK